MTQCRARRRLVQPSSFPGNHPQLGPLLQYSEGPDSALPTPLLLVYPELQRQRLGSNPHRVTTTSDHSAGSSGWAFFHSQGAKQDLLSSLELLISLPPRLDPMPTANRRSGALRPPKPCDRDHPSAASGVSPRKHQQGNLEAAACPKDLPA